MKKGLFIFGILTLWMITIWMAYWAGFGKSQIIDKYVRHLDDVVSLLENKSLLKSLDSQDFPQVRRAITEKISFDSTNIGVDFKERDSWLDELRPLVYPREGLILVSIYNDSRKREAAMALKMSHTNDQSIPTEK